jgi:hypothetical protein
MTDIEIVDDSGEEFSVTDVPIPFYIRCKLEGEHVRYRVKLVDEPGNIRGYYTGTSKRDYLELHVPVIPLRKQGKILIEIELYDPKLNEMTTRKANIEYVDQKTYQKLKTVEKPEDYTEETEKKEFEAYSELGKEPSESNSLEKSELIKSDIEGSLTQESEHTSTSELTKDEITYLYQRAEILQEAVEPDVTTEIKEISEIRTEEEE